MNASAYFFHPLAFIFLLDPLPLSHYIFYAELSCDLLFNLLLFRNYQ